SITEAFEISASISDSNGNLLAYLSIPHDSQDSATLRNANNDTILNGDGINTWGTFAGGAIFIPKPKSNNQYYLFYIGDNDAPQGTFAFKDGIFYALIDMSLEGGKGSILEKNMLLYDGFVGEGITATKHANGIDWWLLAHEVHLGDP